jgi:hypothetical protein
LRPILDELELRLAPTGATSPAGFSPSQIRAACGIDQIVFGTTQGDGSGQTIAIVDADDDPNLADTTSSNFSASDLARFDQEFNLPDPPQLQRTQPIRDRHRHERLHRAAARDGPNRGVKDMQDMGEKDAKRACSAKLAAFERSVCACALTPVLQASYDHR